MLLESDSDALSQLGWIVIQWRSLYVRTVLSVHVRGALVLVN